MTDIYCEEEKCNYLSHHGKNKQAQTSLGTVWFGENHERSYPNLLFTCTQHLFPFYVKKLFTRNTVTDVTDGYYVGITVVTT